MVSNPFRRNKSDMPTPAPKEKGYDSPESGSAVVDAKAANGEIDDSKITFFRMRIFAMALIVSMGGFIFGYDTGQISGFISMKDFQMRFADPVYDAQGNFTGTYEFPNWKEGTIVGLLSIGTLMGSLVTGPIADALGRKNAIVLFNMVFCVGVIVQISSANGPWYQVALGRWVAGLGVGGLSVMTPMYQSETAPKQIRGGLVSAYQLFITAGIFLSYCINYGTNGLPGPQEWQIPMGIGFIFPLIMATGILFLRESPRWDYRRGKISEARKTIALSYGVPENHREVVREIREIKEKFDAENIGGNHPWYEVFTGPRMAYRTVLGMVLQSLQQLTGANFFFYYGTSVFANIQSPGLQDSFVTSIILGTINFASTFLGLYIVDRFGRRRSLIPGAAWMFICFMIFASIGTFKLQPNIPQADGTLPPGADPAVAKTAATVMIIFTCVFIFGYAITWGPIVWALVGEIYPSRYRAKSMGFATSANWLWNFLIAFFTPYITSAINYKYGYVFAGCNFVAIFIVYFLVPESQGRTLEEIDTMYIMHVKAWQSTKWQPPVGEDYGETDRAYLQAGGRNIQKDAHAPADEQRERADV